MVRGPKPGVNKPLTLPHNLYDSETYPSWMECEGLIGYARTSPSEKPRYSPEWQRAEIEGFARLRGIPLVSFFADAGKGGHSIGPKTTPELFQAIGVSRQFGYSVIAWDWTRFSREPHKLARFGVDFVSILPLDMDRRAIHGVGTRRGMDHRAKQGRHIGPPVTIGLSAWLMAVACRREGMSYREIAKELAKATGVPWDHKKVKRFIDDPKRHGMLYVDSLIGA